MKILANKNGFVLAHDEYYGDYCFGTEREIKNLSMPCNQYGTKKEIKAELERWKKEVDFDNPRMLEVEAFFISVLTHCENQSKRWRFPPSAGTAPPAPMRQGEQ